MKKSYNAPNATLISMNFNEHIATSGNIGGSCSWDWGNYEKTLNGGCATNFQGNAL